MIDSRIVADFPECYAVNIVPRGHINESSQAHVLRTRTIFSDIIELFALCKGGNFNIHIWALFVFFIC